jgi:hypothetical protein
MMQEGKQRGHGAGSLSSNVNDGEVEARLSRYALAFGESGSILNLWYILGEIDYGGIEL